MSRLNAATTSAIHHNMDVLARVSSACKALDEAVNRQAIARAQVAEAKRSLHIAEQHLLAAEHDLEKSCEDVVRADRILEKEQALLRADNARLGKVRFAPAA